MNSRNSLVLPSSLLWCCRLRAHYSECSSGTFRFLNSQHRKTPSSRQLVRGYLSSRRPVPDLPSVWTEAGYGSLQTRHCNPRRSYDRKRSVLVQDLPYRILLDAGGFPFFIGLISQRNCQMNSNGESLDTDLRIAMLPVR